jgi:hypothetical protein
VPWEHGARRALGCPRTTRQTVRKFIGSWLAERSLVRHAAQDAQGSGVWSALALQNRRGSHRFGIRGNGQADLKALSRT